MVHAIAYHTLGYLNTSITFNSKIHSRYYFTILLFFLYCAYIIHCPVL